MVSWWFFFLIFYIQQYIASAAEFLHFFEILLVSSVRKDWRPNVDILMQ